VASVRRQIEGAGKSGGIGMVWAAVAIALYIVTVDNVALWRMVWQTTAADRLVVAETFFALMLSFVVIVLALSLGRRAFKLVGAALLIGSAGMGFFMQEFGTVIDESIIRSVIETDMRETMPLISTAFLLHVLLFGALPAGVLLLVPLRWRGWRRDVAARAALVAASLAFTAGSAYANYWDLSVYLETNRHVRLFINPGYPVYAFVRLLAGDGAGGADGPVALTAGARRLTPAYASPARPKLTVFVLGETARADRFSYNGYARDTNRYTRPLGVVNFSDVSACGTSTADSLPCVFSALGRADFSHAAARRRENLMQLLERMGNTVAWRDNSTGCKGVCDEEDFVELAGAADAQLCDATGCFDEILLQRLADVIAGSAGDTFIVLHQRGSHGPAYFTTVPEHRKEYLPECRLDVPSGCALDLISNAYDNTILYTDYFLSRVIEFLVSFEQSHDVAMLYVSDHGESLGENGMYLHGFPYALAPPEQTHVPMLFWAPDDYYGRRGISRDCLIERAAQPTTHDAVYHTLLAMADVTAETYDPALDVLGACRQSQSQQHSALR